MFKTFTQFALLKESANRSVGHLIALAHSPRLMVVISSFRGGRDQQPPRSMDNLMRDIRSQRGFEVVPNPACAMNPLAPAEVEGPGVFADMPTKTGHMGITPSVGGFKEKRTGPDGEEVSQDVCEDSIVVSHKRGAGHPSDEEVLAFFRQLCVKYHQEAFLFKSPASDEVFYVYPNGSMDSLGVLDSATTLDPYFTHLRKGPAYKDRRVKAGPANKNTIALNNLGGGKP